MAANTDRQLMPPPPARQPRHVSVLPGTEGPPKAVLAEEEFTAQLEAIIERDFFPDIPKLHNQLEWAQAVNSGDPALIRAAQVNIARRRAGLKTPAMATGVHQAGLGQTPGTGAWGATPGTTLLRTPAMTPLAAAAGATPAVHGVATPGPGSAAAVAAVAASALTGGELRAPPVTLDTFLAAHTSEDNASFARLQDRQGERKRQRLAHHLEDKNRPLLLTGPGANPTEEYGTSGQAPMTLAMAKHNPTSALYYVPDQKPLSLQEAEQLAKAPPKAINHRATRLKPAGSEELPAALAAAVGVADGAGAGVAGVGAGRGAGDFSRLATPALTPGALGESPLMTWGDIASTPLRLEGEDAPVVLDRDALAGPAFNVPAPPRREMAGRELAAAKTIKELKKRRADAAASAATLPPGAGAVFGGSLARPLSGAPGTCSRTPAMSPAAQQLARMVKGKGATPGAGDLDKALRASYSKSGLRATPGRLTTPGRPQHTPGSTPGGAAIAKPGGSTPLVGGAPRQAKQVSVGSLVGTMSVAAGGGAAKGGLTDDLLKL